MCTNKLRGSVSTTGDSAALQLRRRKLSSCVDRKPARVPLPRYTRGFRTVRNRATGQGLGEPQVVEIETRRPVRIGNRSTRLPRVRSAASGGNWHWKGESVNARLSPISALFALVVAVLTTSALVAQERQTAGDNRDADIRAAVEERLAERDIRGIDVTVEGGVVTLSGTVRNVWQNDRAIEKAREVDGVVSVVDRLEVMEVESERIMAMDIAQGIRNSVYFTIFDNVDMEVNDGVVTLTGQVTMPHKAEEFEELAARVDGVREVRNEIETLPASSRDDRLRMEVARNIYADSVFWQYAVQVRPPIHIIVERGHVTLVGVVGSQLERVRAEMLARQTFGVMGVENQLRIE
jgi:osmotically-inducible protein OsmY